MKTLKSFVLVGVIIFCLVLGQARSSHADTIGIFGDRQGEGASLAATLTGLGHTVTNATAVNSVNLGGLGTLSTFDTLWHVGAGPAALSASDQTALGAYVAGGGGLHLTGERPCCEVLNASIQTFLNANVTAGGITVGGLGDISGPYPFNPNAVGGVTSAPNSLTTWFPTGPGGTSGLGGLAAPSNVLAKAEG